MELLTIALLSLGAYLMGSLPFGLWLVKAWKGVDVREVGSGNIGATNVYRAAGKGAAAAVLLLDATKGALPVVVAQALGVPTWALALVGLLAILGHSKSVFLGFKGGKSVATGIGAIMAMAPLPGLVVLGLWAAIFAVSRTVSLASIGAAAALPFVLFALHAPLPVIVFGALAALYVIVRHRANIQRLVSGTEKRL